MEQARIQANLHALKEEKEKDAPIAEVNTLLPGLQDMGFEVHSEAKSPVPQAIKDERTTVYVSEQTSLHSMGSAAAMESINPLPTSSN